MITIIVRYNFLKEVMHEKKKKSLTMLGTEWYNG